VARLGRNYSVDSHGAQRNFARGKQPAPYDGKPSMSAPEIASWCLASAALLVLLLLHLLPALLAGLLVYELVHVIAPLLQSRFSGERARLVAVVILSTAVVGLLTAAILGVILFFRSDAGSLPTLVRRLADIIEGSRNSLPAWVVTHLPSDPEALRDALAHWLREHAPELQLAGKEAGRAIAHILLGMIVGAMISLREAVSLRAEKPLARALSERIIRLGDSFRRVVFAQVRISGLNTIFTGLYLAVLLPLFDIHLPFTKTLIGVTFIAGLLPVIGNLISNTVIFIVSLANSLQVALASLVFLVVIHKLEYFLNARIIGSKIQARPWELLIAMLTMEAAFGLPGLAAAPIYYAYLKSELADRGLV
jgi:predicted PurR-regulated permease PerM